MLGPRLTFKSSFQNPNWEKDWIPSEQAEEAAHKNGQPDLKSRKNKD